MGVMKTDTDIIVCIASSPREELWY